MSTKNIMANKGKQMTKAWLSKLCIALILVIRFMNETNVGSLDVQQEDEEYLRILKRVFKN